MITLNELSQMKTDDQDFTRNLVIDNYPLPFAPGQLTLLGAYTGMGRTMFLLHLFAGLFGKYAQPVLFVSNEEKEQQLFRKMASLLAGQYFNHDNDVPDELVAQHKVLSSDKCKMLWFDNNWEKLKAELVHWGKENRNGFLFIDKIQGLYIKTDYKNRNSELRIIIRELKQWAAEYQISVIVSSSIKKGLYHEYLYDIPLSKLVNKSVWEDFADLILILQRPSVYGITEDQEGNSIRHLAEIYVAKNKSGPLHDIRMYFNENYPGFRTHNKLERLRMSNPALGALVNHFGLIDKDSPF